MRKQRAKPDNQSNDKRNIEPKKTVDVKKSFHLDFLTPSQKLAWECYQTHDLIFLLGAPGTGKSHLATGFAIHDLLKHNKEKIVVTRPVVEAGENLGFLPGPQPLDAKILTPNGWKLMGEIQLDDMVIGRNGLPTKVVGVFPKGKKAVYKISTTEGTSTECCDDHLWLTKTKNDRKHNKNGSVKLTKEIKNTLLDQKGKINHFLPRNEPIQFNKQNLPLSPYVLGSLLGDGHIGSSISLANKDSEIIERVNSELDNVNCWLTKNKNSISHTVRSNLSYNKTARRVLVTNVETNDYFEYQSVGIASRSLSDVKLSALKNRCERKLIINGLKYEFLKPKNRWTNPVKDILYNLGLSGKRANDKFIPDVYKYSSVEDRISLFRGLMDTDGTVKKTGEASFSTVSEKLANDVIELVRSLGGRATLRNRNRKNKILRTSGKNIKHNFISYEFTISLPDHINPFHVSRKSARFSSKYIHSIGISSIEYIGDKEVQCILVDNPEHLYITDDYIVTHNTMDEKILPYMMPIYDCINKICGKSSKDREIVAASLEVSPLAYMRGRTFDNCVFILDEAQNCTYQQLKLAITRLGKGSKMIITGDPDQSDLPGPVALEDVMAKISPVAGVGVVRFKENSIVRHPLLSRIIKRL